MYAGLGCSFFNFLTAAAVQGNKIHSTPLIGNTPGYITRGMWEKRNQLSSVRENPAVLGKPSPGHAHSGTGRANDSRPSSAAHLRGRSPPRTTQGAVTANLPAARPPGSAGIEALSGTAAGHSSARILGQANTVKRGSPWEQKKWKFRAKYLISIWQHHHFQEDTRKRFAETCLPPLR